MRNLRPEDYEKLAQTVVDTFIDHDTPLSDGVVKVARELELNPNQIRNLTQLSNVNAHLRLFEKRAEDKIVEFTPVDPRAVIHAVLQESTTEKTASDDERYNRDLDFFGDFAQRKSEPTEKLAEVEDNGKPAHGPDYRTNLVLRLQKVAEELNSQRLQHAHTYVEELDKLASEFAKLYGPDFGSFEKDAVSRFGQLAVPTLNDIRSRLRMDKIGMDTVSRITKVARVVDDETPEMLSLKKLIESATKSAECARSLDYLGEQAQQLGGAP